MVDLAYILHEELRRENLDEMGHILHQSWLLKRDLTAGISSGQIDDWYERARTAGALGGKLLGAGGGGFLLVYARPEDHTTIEAALPELRRTDFCFDNRGSRIILFHND
jgi:D-glycero-alpha-D-manno-heptose-7-phosphate kinase